MNSPFRGMRCNVSTLFLIFGASHFEKPRLTRIIRLTKSEEPATQGNWKHEGTTNAKMAFGGSGRHGVLAMASLPSRTFRDGRGL